MPTLDIVLRIAEYFGVTVEELSQKKFVKVSCCAVTDQLHWPPLDV